MGKQSKDDEIPPIGPPVIWPPIPPDDVMSIPDILEWVEYETRMGGELSADKTMRLKTELAKHGGEPTNREPPSPPQGPPATGPLAVEEPAR